MYPCRRHFQGHIATSWVNPRSRPTSLIRSVGHQPVAVASYSSSVTDVFRRSGDAFAVDICGGSRGGGCPAPIIAVVVKHGQDLLDPAGRGLLIAIHVILPAKHDAPSLTRILSIAYQYLALHTGAIPKNQH